MMCKRYVDVMVGLNRNIMDNRLIVFKVVEIFISMWILGYVILGTYYIIKTPLFFFFFTCSNIITFILKFLLIFVILYLISFMTRPIVTSLSVQNTRT